MKIFTLSLALAGSFFTPVFAQEQNVTITSASMSVSGGGGPLTPDQGEELKLDGVVTNSAGQIINYRFIPGTGDNGKSHGVKGIAIKAWTMVGDQLVAIADPEVLKTAAGQAVANFTADSAEFAKENFVSAYQDGILYIVHLDNFTSLQKTDNAIGALVNQNIIDLGNFFGTDWEDIKTRWNEGSPWFLVPGTLLDLGVNTLELAKDLIVNVYDGGVRAIAGTFRFVKGLVLGTGGTVAAAGGLTVSALSATIEGGLRLMYAGYLGVIEGTVAGGHPDVTFVPGALYLWNGVAWAFVYGLLDEPTEDSVFVKLGLITISDGESHLCEGNYRKDSFRALVHVSILAVAGNAISTRYGTAGYSKLEASVVINCANGAKEADSAEIARITNAVAADLQIQIDTAAVERNFALHAVINGQKPTVK